MMTSTAQVVPRKTLYAILAAWFAAAVLNHTLLLLGLETGTPHTFPVSILRGPDIHWPGIPWLIGFALVLVWALRDLEALRLRHVWLAGLLLMVLGNLGQGGWHAAFRLPFLASDMQYYHDALNITAWKLWLASFNAIQEQLLTHARTHPPLAVLLHYGLLQLAGYNLDLLAVLFILLASSAVPLWWLVLKVFDVPPSRRNALALLFAVIPAVNVYLMISLDGAVLVATLLFLLGLVMVIRRRGRLVYAVALTWLGLMLANLMTFGGLFLLDAGGLLALYFLFVHRDPRPILAGVAVLAMAMLTLLSLNAVYSFDYWECFLTATRLQNPEGFRLLAEPLAYVMTRLESVFEMLLFLGLPLLALMMHPSRLGPGRYDLRRTEDAIAAAAVFTILMMFASGAFHTGETARAALFIYPFLLLPARRAEMATLRSLIVLCAAQTAVMQLMASYVW